MKLNRKVYVLDFEGTEYPDLVVKVRSLPTGEMLALVGLADLAKDVKAGDVGKIAELQTLFEAFANCLVEWNIEYDDSNDFRPTTVDEVLKLDFDLVLKLIDGWMTVVAGVSGPLDASSTSGETSQVAGLQTEPL